VLGVLAMVLIALRVTLSLLLLLVVDGRSGLRFCTRQCRELKMMVTERAETIS
jgi:hypothetical protein